MKKILKIFAKYLIITFGCALYAFGFYAFIKSAGITTGGVTGFVNVVNMIRPVQIGLLVMLINIPLLIISLVVLKWRFTISTLYGTFISSFFITVFENTLNPYLPFTDNVMIAGLVGGALTGAGLGIVMRNRSSTGGTDIVIKLLHRKWRYLSGGTLHVIIDGALLVFFFAVTHNFESTIFAMITMVVSNVVYDVVLYGVNTSKTVYIITDQADIIVPELIKQCDCGATVIDAKGAYTHKERDIVLCVVKNQMFPTLKDVVQQCDDNAFVIVSKSSEIYGKGFKADYKDALS